MRRPRALIRVRQQKNNAPPKNEKSEGNGTVQNGYCNGSGAAEPIPQSGGWVRLNVGGVVFQTTKTTLCREDGFLSRLVKEDEDLPSEKDGAGAYLIDRDPQYFSPVLNYLRHGKLVLNHGISEEGVLQEADFYNLPGLSQMVLDRIQEKKDMEKLPMKHVYRVLQCHGEELTSVVSALTDDWRLEQLIPVGAPVYSTDVQREYLCVVSRECREREEKESQDRAKLLQQKARNN